MRLPDSHKGWSDSIREGYSFQREWEQWNKWRRTSPCERPPVIRSHGTWLRSSPPQLGSAGKTQAQVIESSSVLQAEEGGGEHDVVDLYLEDSENCCWECVKVGCWRFIFKIKSTGRKQAVFECNQAQKPQHSHSPSCLRMEQLIVLSIRLLHIISAKYMPITFELSVSVTLWLSVYSSQMDELC